MKLSRIVVVGVAVAVVGLGGLVPLAASASSPRNQLAALRAPGIHYATVKPACSAPAPGRAACFALRRVPATKGTPDAHAYRVPANVTTGLAGGYTPAELAKAYGINPAGGSGQTVGIIDAFNDPTVVTDLAAFDTHYGLPAETASSFQVLNQTGAASPLPTDDAGWAGEETLDVQVVRGLCHACKIRLIEGTSNSFSDLATATNTAATLHATEISNSYGGPENSGSITPTTTADYNHPGIVITASTGDDGMFNYDKMFNSVASANHPSYPSSLPTVVAVGGTSLHVNSDGSYGGETVWNSNGPRGFYADQIGRALGATGGGCSTVSTPTAWQAAVPGWAHTGCTGRLPADVSAVADPFTGFDLYQTYGGPPTHWETVGGTSLSAPVIAAMWALAGGAHGTKYPSLDLYGHLASSPGTFHDVVIGGNGLCDGDSATHCSGYWATANPNTLGAGIVDCAFAPTGTTVLSTTGSCDATKGYDGPTGVGTPNGVTLFKPVSIKVSITAKQKSRTKLSFAAKAVEPTPGGTHLTYVWSWGDGTKSTKGAKPTHTFHGTGKHTVKVTVTDSFAQHGTSKHVVKIKKAKKH